MSARGYGSGLLVLSFCLLLLLPFFRIFSQFLLAKPVFGFSEGLVVGVQHLMGLVVVASVAIYLCYHFRLTLPTRFRALRLLPVVLSVLIGVLGGIFFVGELEGQRLNALLVIGILVSALVEELVFRGVFLTVWAGRFGAVRVVLMQAVLFSVAHPMHSVSYMAGYFVYALLVGGLVCYYPRSGLLYAMLAHLTSNLTEIVLVTAGGV